MRGRGLGAAAGNGDDELAEIQRKEKERKEREQNKRMAIVRMHSQLKADILNAEFNKNLVKGGDAKEAAKQAEAAATKAGELVANEEHDTHRKFVQQVESANVPETSKKQPNQVIHSIPGRMPSAHREKTFVYLNTYLKLLTTNPAGITGTTADIAKVLEEAIATVPIELGRQRSEFSVEVSQVVVRCLKAAGEEASTDRFFDFDNDIEEISLDDSNTAECRVPTCLTCKASLRFYVFDAISATEILEEMHRFVGFHAKSEANDEKGIQVEWEHAPRRSGPICSVIRSQIDKLGVTCTLDFDTVAKAKVKLVGLRGTSGYQIDTGEDD